MVLRQGIAHTGRMTDRGEGALPAAFWSEDLRTCTARAFDGNGHVVQIAFASAEPVSCPIARARMEHAALTALGVVIDG